MSLLGLLLVGLTVFCGLTPAFCKSWDEFRRDHIDQNGHLNKDEKYCTKVIYDRKIKDNNGDCKPTNTFIHKDEATVKAVCDKEQENVFVKSKTDFLYTLCKLVKVEKGYCVYKEVIRFSSPIVVVCKGGAPVHLERVV